MKKYLAFLALALFTSPLFAQQITSFTDDPEKYIKELDEYVNTTKREDCKTTMDEFEDMHKKGTITDDMVKTMITSSNVMIGRKMQAYPYFEEYVNAVINFAGKSGKQADIFFQWSVILDQLTNDQKKGNNKVFENFMDFSNGLFGQNAIYTSAAKTWKVVPNDYTFEYKDNKPTLVFGEGDLLGITVGDTIVIHKTSGTYYPLETSWLGGSAKVDWSRAGQDAAKVYSTFDKYTVSTDKSEFRIDSALFYDTEILPEPIKGVLEDKLISNNSDDKSTYPRFDSYTKTLSIKNIAEGVDYQGGISIKGSKIYGFGDETQRAILTFYTKAGKKALVARSTSIIIHKPIEINADRAQVTLYFGSDSIYHPGVDLSFKIAKRELDLYRGTEGVSKTDFYDSFHKQFITADAIYWKIDQPKIDIKMISGAGQSPAIFKSQDYFKKGEIEKWQGTMDFNPIWKTYMYAKKNDTREFLDEELAKAWGPYSKEQIKSALYAMEEAGFVFYDEPLGIVKVTDKLMNYVDADKGNIDYDNIMIKSFSDTTNAELNMDNFDYEMHGVKDIPVSDSQFVIFFPGKGDTKIKKNRDMEFSGTIFGGRLDFLGDGFYFNYDAFNVDMKTLKQMQINIPDTSGKVDEKGDPELIPLNTKIEDLSGLLEIDASYNKSGRDTLKQYPIFRSNKQSYTYYDKPKTFNGVYKRDKFFFRLEPFAMYSLDNFKPDTLSFPGSLVSAGIFPDFQEKLKIQKDLSLGFVTKTPKTGYALYGGKGKYNDTITLNNNGLRGSGKINYLTSESKARDIIFFPDSLKCTADSFNVKKQIAGTQYPDVVSADDIIFWQPYKDMMDIKMKTTPFAMFNKETSFKGSLRLEPTGLLGNGTLEWAEASLTSKKFEFAADALQADTSSLAIKSVDANKVTFNTPNVNAHVDFKKRFGEFKSNTKDIATNFSYNQYITSLNEFNWDMNKGILEFKSPPESQGSYFVSTNANQDSLKFIGKRATYVLKTSVLDVYGIPEIRVADGAIIPDSGHVTIDSFAMMRKLNKAKIVLDTTNKYHNIYNATLQITGKKSFTGSGSYDLKIKQGPAQKIQFDNITVQKNESNYNIVADGNITPDQNFLFDPMVSYKGPVHLDSYDKKLTYSGFAHLNLKNPLAVTDWWGFKDKINPDTLVFHETEPKNEQGNRVYCGFFLNSSDTTGIYTNIMAARTSSRDGALFTADGIVKFDPASGQLEFGDEQRINGKSTTGNIFKYNDGTGQCFAQGKVNLGLDFGAIGTQAAGTIEHNLSDSVYTFNLVYTLDIELSKSLMESLGTDLYNYNSDMPDVHYDNPDFLSAISELIGDPKESDKFIQDFKASGVFSRPKAITSSIVFPDLKLTYNRKTKTFVSQGPVGVSFFGDKSIDKELKGFVEFGTRRSSDYFNIYFETNLNDWYFLSYASSTLQILTSDEQFNQAVVDLDPEKRRVKTDDGKYYIYSISTQSKMKSFVNRMKGIDMGDGEDPDKEKDKDK